MLFPGLYIRSSIAEVSFTFFLAQASKMSDSDSADCFAAPVDIESSDGSLDDFAAPDVLSEASSEDLSQFAAPLLEDVDNHLIVQAADADDVDIHPIAQPKRRGRPKRLAAPPLVEVASSENVASIGSSCDVDCVRVFPVAVGCPPVDGRNRFSQKKGPTRAVLCELECILHIPK